jgi:hypothetical protein
MRVPYCHSERMRGIFPQTFLLSVGERKFMNHFVVKSFFPRSYAESVSINRDE